DHVGDRRVSRLQEQVEGERPLRIRRRKRVSGRGGSHLLGAPTIVHARPEHAALDDVHAALWRSLEVEREADREWRERIVVDRDVLAADALALSAREG